jgi:transposase
MHLNDKIYKTISQHGHQILWLPPYSPDLNPIEKMWAESKKEKLVG